MEQKKLTCIVCPMGCSLTVTLEGGKVQSVSGNTCPRGAKYGEEECTHPTPQDVYKRQESPCFAYSCSILAFSSGWLSQ